MTNPKNSNDLKAFTATKPRFGRRRLLGVGAAALAGCRFSSHLGTQGGCVVGCARDDQAPHLHPLGWRISLSLWVQRGCGGSV